MQITFTSSSLTPWNILKYCLLHPSITSIVYRNSRTFAIEEPPTGDELARTPIPLSNFAYVETAWREIWQQLRGVRPVVQFTREAKWLAALVPNMAQTIQHLDIPMETAPIPRMAEISWPKLLTLTIRGRYLSEAQAESLPAFLSTLPHLQKQPRKLILVSSRRVNETGSNANEKVVTVLSLPHLLHKAETLSTLRQQRVPLTSEFVL